MQNNTQQNVQKSPSSPTQKTAPQPRFAVTPQSVGMDSAILQPRNPSEQICQPRQAPPSTSQPSVTFKPCSKEQVVQQLQSSNQNISPLQSPNRSVTELRSSAMASNASVYKPLCYERRSSSPSSPSTSLTHGAATFIPPLSNTAQNVIRSFSAQVSQKMSSPCSTPTNEGECSRHSATCDVKHECLPPSEEIPIQHFEQQLQKFRSGSNFFSGGAAEINAQLNDIFVNRIKDIDADGQGDTNLKLVTYQEWVEMLLKINESILSNVEELEIEVDKRLEYFQQRVSLNCRHSQGNELMQSRKDIDTLIKIIQNGLHSNEWDLQGMTFETVTPVQVFGLSNKELEKRHNDAQNSTTAGNSLEAAVSMQRNKLLANMKALALEVAEKHDEVRDLKRQMACLEDDIQKAQKKIQFKDDVIKELRTDLKRNAKINSPQSVDDSVAMPPINHENETARAQKTTGLPASYTAPLETSLSENERLEQQKISQLSDDLEEYLTLNRHLSENQCKNLSEILKKAESEKNEAFRKLDFIRRQLTDLENSVNKPPAASIEIAAQDNDSGISSNRFDQDSKILDGVRKRMRSLNESVCDLRLKLQKSEREKSELSTNLMASEAITQRNDETLRDVAELLCEITGQSFSYTDIYKMPNQNRVNPFCETIVAMKSVYQQREAQLMQSMAQKNQKIEELMERISHAEKLINEQQKQRTNLSEGEDIDKITPPASLLLQSQQATLLPHSTVQQTSLLMTRQAKENSLSDEYSHRQ